MRAPVRIRLHGALRVASERPPARPRERLPPPLTLSRARVLRLAASAAARAFGCALQVASLYFFLITGTVGFAAAYTFVWQIYGAVKVD